MHWRHIELRNPLRPRTPTFLESLLAKEAEEKKQAEKEQKALEKARRKEEDEKKGVKRIWSLTRGIIRRLKPNRCEEPQAEITVPDTMAATHIQAESRDMRTPPEDRSRPFARFSVVREPWEGDWSEILQDIQ
ncbi:hypothetical protein ACN47E_001079 [Coniothyrium glycines]